MAATNSLRTLLLPGAAAALGLALLAGYRQARAAAPAVAPVSTGANLVRNPGFELPDAQYDAPDGYQLTGAARWVTVGYRDEYATPGITLEAYRPEGHPAGTVSQLVKGVDPRNGKWLRFTFRGLAEDDFTVEKDQLYMKLEFFSKRGEQSRDAAQRLIYREITKDRKELGINGKFQKGGGAVWRTYELEELLPFPEVDAVRVTVGFKGGSAKSERHAAFFVDDFSLTQQSASSSGLVDPADVRKPPAPPTLASVDRLIPLGGRWYYRPANGETVPTDAQGHLSGPLQVTGANADRLYYRDDRLSNPFAGNMAGWLHEGYLDLNGDLVKKERLVPDSVILQFDGKGSLAVRSKNLPDHPTARFPDRYGTQGYNPNYIQEQRDVWYLPLSPARNPEAGYLGQNGSNRALPMGPIGVAVNGVVFFNPYDMGMTDATNLMDRCCGHPAQDYRYHYHKYPICVNTPFVDKGEGHSPLIGFAFDGYPLYGPYESAGEMAKDVTSNPLNAFNGHEDKIRGWHYHVTPGKFPYLLGGYYGKVDLRNFRRGRP
jgi:hypothetical protein